MTGLNRISPEEQQCLNIFLHHHNAEMGRNFQVTQKLDAIYQSIKMPDFLCSDGNDYLIVEVTSVYFELQDLKWTKGWHDITRAVRNSTKGKAPGIYLVKASYPIKWKGGQFGKCQLINSLNTVIQKHAQGMKVGESVELNTPIRLTLTKCSDIGSNVAFMSDPQLAALTSAYIEELFCPIFIEASEKFTNAKAKYPNATSVLLIENRNWLLSETDPDDCKDVASVIAQLNYKHVDCVYLMSLREQKMVQLV